jgi:Uncharacterized conserved protein
MVSVNVEIKESQWDVAVITLSEKMEVLSSAILNGGRAVTDTFMIMEVPKNYDDRNPIAHIRKVRDELKLPDSTVGFMTAAEVRNVTSKIETEYNGIKTTAVATAGLTNIITAGDVIDNWDERMEKRESRTRPGTINIIAFAPFPLSDIAKVNSFIVITESKTAALNSFGYKETGTTSDAMAIVSPINGKREDYTGTGTDVGISMARSVKEAVRSAVIKREDFLEMGTFLDQLLLLGISKEKMWDAALKLYIPNPNWDIAKIKEMFLRKLDVYSKDINASSLVQAAMELERLGNADCLCAMPKGMFAEDPIHLIADEILGMQLAQYIAGTRGIFEFHRFDRHKPGMIGELGPFLDDIICGLVGGIMSSIYTELFEEEI